MKTTYDGDRRATRLLRWYPPAWRERYGEEFVAHLEQEFADRPTDFRRSVNIVFKGLVARVGDLGFSNASVRCLSRVCLVGGPGAVISTNGWTSSSGTLVSLNDTGGVL